LHLVDRISSGPPSDRQKRKPTSADTTQSRGASAERSRK
jgi:hypothetical protein